MWGLGSLTSTYLPRIEKNNRQGTEKCSVLLDLRVLHN